MRSGNSGVFLLCCKFWKLWALTSYYIPPKKMLNVMRSIAGWMYLGKNVHSFQKVTFLFMSTSGSLFCILYVLEGTKSSYRTRLQICTVVHIVFDTAGNS